VTRIATRIEARGPGDVRADWIIIARQTAPGMWAYCGTLERTLAGWSTCQRRDGGGTVLLARIAPVVTGRRSK
jgi:hypothetical protein